MLNYLHLLSKMLLAIFLEATGNNPFTAENHKEEINWNSAHSLESLDWDMAPDAENIPGIILFSHAFRTSQ
jgi:hypothetical protein